MPEESPEFVTAKDQSFVTVSEAARSLGIGERRAYRLTGKLSDTQKRVSDTSDSGKCQTLVCVNALSRLLSGEASVEEKGTQESVRQAKRQTEKLSDSQVSDRGAVSDTLKPMSDSQTALLLVELETEKRRAAVLEAERDGLQARLADTASDRDAWKEQAGRLTDQAQALTEALRAAQDEARAARVIGGSNLRVGQRQVQQIGAAGDSSGDTGPGGGITVGAVKRPWWAFWKGRIG